MLTWSQTGTSEESPVQALDNALRKAVKDVKGSPHADIYFHGARKMSKGWRADVSVIAEPKRAKHKQSEQEEDPQALKAQEEAVQIEQRQHEMVRKHDFDEFEHTVLERELDDEYAVMEDQMDTLVLYAELASDEIVNQVLPQYEFDAVHFLSEGSLWDAAKEKHPDLEMYESVHTAGNTPGLFATAFGPEVDTEPEPEGWWYEPEPTPEEED